MQRSWFWLWPFSGSEGNAFSSFVFGGWGNASMSIVSEGTVDSFLENETLFFIRRKEGAVVETDGTPLLGTGGGWPASISESTPKEEVEVVEVWENTESTEERMLEEMEELERWFIEQRLAWMRFGSAENKAYSIKDSTFL